MVAALDESHRGRAWGTGKVPVPRPNGRFPTDRNKCGEKPRLSCVSRCDKYSGLRLHDFEIRSITRDDKLNCLSSLVSHIFVVLRRGAFRTTYSSQTNRIFTLSITSRFTLNSFKYWTPNALVHPEHFLFFRNEHPRGEVTKISNEMAFK